MKILKTTILAALVLCGTYQAARADYFVWRDEKSGMSLSFPDTWRMDTGQQPNDAKAAAAEPSPPRAQHCLGRYNLHGL